MGLAKAVISGLIGIISTQSLEVPITTSIQKDSPITVQGFVQAIKKKDAEGRVFPSYELRGSVSNNSSRDILLVVIKFNVKHLSVSRETKIRSTDYFFEPGLLTPNSVTSFEESGLPYGIAKVEAVPMPASGKAVATVAFVEFSNGETWGNPHEAAEALRARSDALRKLQALKDTYNTEGPDRLIEQLGQCSEMPFVSSVYVAYRDEKSVAIAVQKVDSMLAAAKSHKVN